MFWRSQLSFLISASEQFGPSAIEKHLQADSLVNQRVSCVALSWVFMASHFLLLMIDFPCTRAGFYFSQRWDFVEKGHLKSLSRLYCFCDYCATSRAFQSDCFVSREFREALIVV